MSIGWQYRQLLRPPEASSGDLFGTSVALHENLLVAGSPRGYPDPTSVANALLVLGVPVQDIQINPEQSWGVRSFTGTTDSGTPIAIKAYGRDATESQLAAKLWRTLWYREDGQTLGGPGFYPTA